MKAVFKFWCYDISDIVAYPFSVEVEVEAFGEEQALKKVKQMVEREVYTLLSVKIL